MASIVRSGLTASLTRAGLVRGVAAPPPPAWTPASLPGIVDFGIWSDLSRLKNNPDGSGSVVATNDPVGYWQGQLGALALVSSAAAGTKWKYDSANGVGFDAGGTRRSLTGTNLGSGSVRFARTLAIAFKRGSTVNDEVNYPAFVFNTAPDGSGSAILGFNNVGASQFVAVNQFLSTNLGAFDTNIHRVIVSADGSAGGAAAWFDGAKTSPLSGTSTATNTRVLAMRSPSTLGAGWAFAWVETSDSAQLSAEDAALLDAWLLAQVPA